MSMEINGLNSGPAGGSKSKGTAALDKSSDSDGKKSTQSSAPAAPASKETVLISSQAKSLSKISTDVSTNLPVDQEKIDRIKAAINDGSFAPNADAIADGMLNTDDLF